VLEDEFFTTEGHGTHGEEYLPQITQVAQIMNMKYFEPGFANPVKFKTPHLTPSELVRRCDILNFAAEQRGSKAEIQY
jgi:hypothetical protein